MACLFKDIHKDNHLQLAEHRVPGLNGNEVLYADDTICVLEDENAMNRLPAEIELLGASY